MPPKSPASTALHAVGDTFDLMQKLWGMATGPTPAHLAALARAPQRLPGMIAPTMDVDELDKRIADLRAVEQWLELNAGMLRTTIQTLEVQRATIATLKGIGGAMLAPVLGDKSDDTRPARAVPHVNPLPGVPPELMTPQAFGTLRPGAKAAKRKPRARASRPSAARSSASPAAGLPALGDDALNPTAWWQTLQDQFTRIAATAAETPAAALKATARASAKALKAGAATAATAATLPVAATAAAASAARRPKARKRARKA